MTEPMNARSAYPVGMNATYGKGGSGMHDSGRSTIWLHAFTIWLLVINVILTGFLVKTVIDVQMLFNTLAGGG